METFAERLKYYRQKAGYSQKELADKIGIKFAAYNNYETKGAQPKIEVLIKMATALNIDVNTLVGFHADNTKDLIETLNNYGIEVKPLDKYHVKIRPRPTLTYMGDLNPIGITEGETISKKRDWKTFNTFTLQDLIGLAEDEAQNVCDLFVKPIIRQRVFYNLFIIDIVEGTPPNPNYGSYEDYINWLETQAAAPETETPPPSRENKKRINNS